MTAAESSVPATGSSQPGAQHDGVVRPLRPGAAARVSAPSVASLEGLGAVDAQGRVVQSDAIVGRHAELARIDEFLAAVAGGARGLVLSGEAGIGKTTLWEAAAARATALGHRVLAHRSAPAEARLAFAALCDLFGAPFAEMADALAPPRRRALEVALLLGEPAGPAPDARAIGLACLDVLRELARVSPVILALDDVQWLDASSAGVLAIALRRLGDARVGVLTTVRDEPHEHAPFALEHALDVGPVRRLRVGPLGRPALHGLLTKRLGADLARADISRLEELSGGNPFYALELVATMRRARAGEVALPDSLRELLGRRLERLSAQTLDVLLYAAAAARPTTAVIAAAHSPGDAALDALELAAREQVVVLADGRIRFAHPLLATLCYEGALPSERRRAHRRLADVVSDEEERARQHALAAHGRDAALAAELDAAAAHAVARGATAAAAELARLAVDRTPLDRRIEQRERRLEAARLCRFAGDLARSHELYAGLLCDLPPGPTHARVLYAVASIATRALPERIRLGEQALAEAGDDAACAAQILGFLGHCRWLLGELDAAMRDTREAVEIAERAADPFVVSSTLARAACVETFALDITPGLLERALSRELAVDRPVAWHENPTFMLSVALVHGRDDLDRARAMLADVEATAIDFGDEDTRPWAVMQLMIVEWYAGNWRRAREHAATAHDLAQRLGHPQYELMVARFTTPVQAGLGLVDDARATAAEAIRLAEEISDERMLIGTLAALGQLELALGDLQAAERHLRCLPERLLRTGHRNPVNGPWADSIETLVACGELDEARTCLATYTEIARRANAWARIGARRCAGLLADAEGDTAAALAAYEDALKADPAVTYPFERARTLLCRGVAERRARRRRAARETLEEALAVFDRIDARLWSRKARDELGRVSGRRSADLTLSDAELRVARLAVQGRQNKEIARELFITVATVEAHLSRVYRKVGVRSRTELVSHLPTQLITDGIDAATALDP